MESQFLTVPFCRRLRGTALALLLALGTATLPAQQTPGDVAPPPDAPPGPGVESPVPPPPGGSEGAVPSPGQIDEAPESASAAAVPTVVQTKQEGADSLIRVTSTVQSWDVRQPWQKDPPRSATSIGAVLSDNRVLITADMAANQNYIELEDLRTGAKCPADVLVADYEANLALVKPQDPEFLANKKPLELTTSAKLGDDLEVWQVQPTGDIVAALGKITSVELVPYSAGNFFLGYRLNLSLQYRYANLTLPIVRGGKLAGMMLRYDGDGQTLDVASGPVIQHFLTEAAKPEYHGFPLSGIQISPMLDPQLRRYMKLPDDMEGVYVEKVVLSRAGAKAGLRDGDIILEIAGHPIDNRGNYLDEVFGRVSLAHLIRTVHFVGDEVEFVIWRDGQKQELRVKMDHRPAQEWLVPPYVLDQQPRYLMVGGILLQELSLPFLQSFGAVWTTAAPQNLIYYQVNQDDLVEEKRDKIVFIVGMVPTQFTIGYEGLSNSVITKVNNQEIKNLDDVEKALQTPAEGFHKLEFEQTPKVIYLDAKELPQIDKIIQETYGVPALKNLG